MRGSRRQSAAASFKVAGSFLPGDDLYTARNSCKYLAMGGSISKNSKPAPACSSGTSSKKSTPKKGKTKGTGGSKKKDKKKAKRMKKGSKLVGVGDDTSGLRRRISEDDHLTTSQQQQKPRAPKNNVSSAGTKRLTGMSKTHWICLQVLSLQGASLLF